MDRCPQRYAAFVRENSEPAKPCFRRNTLKVYDLRLGFGGRKKLSALEKKVTHRKRTAILPYLARTRRRLKKEIRLIRLLRETYTNWLPMSLSRFAGRKITTAELRSSHRLLHMNGSCIHILDNLAGLAHLVANGWEVLHVGSYDIILQEPGSSVRLRARTDVGADLSFIDLVFVEKIYGTDFFGKTVIDAGAYIGETAVYFANRGAVRVISLEPFQKNFELGLENVTRMNNFENTITLLQAALSTEERTADFEFFPDSPNANRIASAENNPSSNLVKVKITTLDSVMREFDLRRINVLKLNCEGEEYPIIDSLTERTASLIDSIYIEFHKGPARLIARLERLGYEVNGETRKEVGYGRLMATRNE